MLGRLPLTVLLLIAALLLPGCALFRRKPTDLPFAAPAPALIGVVALVNEGAGFALIDSGTLPPPPVGAKLRSFSGGKETGEMVATEVRKRPFVIGDIRAGTPRKGDRVSLVRATPAPAVAPVPGAGTAGATAPGAPVLPPPAATVPMGAPELPQLSPGPAFDQ